MPSSKKSNPKNFRNGDVIKISNYEPGMTATSSLVFVKFGENYYNLTAGGQMKACRYLPPGTKEIITNLSGMGKFFLMSEEELEEQASGIDHAVAGGDYSITWGSSGGTTIKDFDYIQKLIQEGEAFIQTDTTEEK